MTIVESKVTPKDRWRPVSGPLTTAAGVEAFKTLFRKKYPAAEFRERVVKRGDRAS